MALHIYNSLTKQKEIFKPVEPGKVKLYVCGITVYDYCHIGHARSYILFDVITRYLRSIGFDVTYVRNITDVDDKIINRANENEEACDALTERFIEAMHEDDRSLGILPHDHEPRATQHMPQIIKLIKKLIENGAAYVASNGDVYFDVPNFKGYGKLSKRDIEKLISGARIEVSEAKKSPLDFVLWKLSKPGEPTWDSPWGPGRPGWHIECSAMSTELLGQPFDIHGGGMDLKFPHHENEIAQSEAACEKVFANTWMHVGLLQVNGEKMSKSLNNFFTIREVLEDHHPEVVRYFMMAGHYRSPVNYSEDNLTKIRNSLESLYLAIRDLSDADPSQDPQWAERFKAAMDDDFNTPEVLALLFEMAHEINRLRKQNKIDEAAQLGATLKRFSEVLGILQEDPNSFLKGGTSDEDAAKIDAMILARNAARDQKDWGEADRLRDELTEMGVVIEDGATGTTWRKQ